LGLVHYLPSLTSYSVLWYLLGHSCACPRYEGTELDPITSSSYIPRRLHTSPTIIPIVLPAVWVCLPSVRVDLLYSIKVVGRAISCSTKRWLPINLSPYNILCIKCPGTTKTNIPRGLLRSR